jgi:hypothetical protein
MLATAIGIDRTIIGNVRRGVIGDHRFRAVDHQFGERRVFLFAPPAILRRLAPPRVETAVGRNDGATAFAGSGRIHAVIIYSIHNR